MGECPGDSEGLLQFLKKVRYLYGGVNAYENRTNSYDGPYEAYLALKTLEALSSPG